MPLQDPVAVYEAASNAEASLVCNALIAANIPAEVLEDLSPMAGATTRAQVWVAQADQERAVAALADLERLAGEATAEDAAPLDPTPVDVVCECGVTTPFHGSLRGTVQECPSCGAYLDVAVEADGEDWGTPEDDAETEPAG